MGGPLPVLGQPTVAYGAAAVMVHPASGYMINRAIKFAPEVADALVDTLRRTDSPLLAAEAAWEAIWPKHRLIERDLYCFGMEVRFTPSSSPPQPRAPASPPRVASQGPGAERGRGGAGAARPGRTAAARLLRGVLCGSQGASDLRALRGWVSL
jgi:hypothetical protein